MSSFYDQSVKKINGQQVSLGDFKGKVLLVVNVASKCGLTPQYEALEKIHEKYQSKGFSVLGFPANEFAGQEPGSNAEIADFCSTKFNVQFPMFEKIVVTGPGTHPLYKILTQEKPSATKTDDNFEKQLQEYGHVRQNPSDVLWNFEKFLISKDGKIIDRFSPEIAPDNKLITEAIEKALA